ncbi:MAG: S26 family signal peptidase [Christensenellaceae bacterium]|jgi:signal peptidase I|nr:S26 family signal peptidase [Christensenellaceae bacterium]
MSVKKKKADTKDQSAGKKAYVKITTILLAIALITVVVAFSAVLMQTSKGLQPSLFGYRVYFILTDSMSPQLEINDCILSKVINSPTQAIDAIDEGDIVSFTASTGTLKGETITHKCISAPYLDESDGKWYIQTQGTKVGAPKDDPVPLENVQAVFTRKLPVIGSIYYAMRTGLGIAVLIIIPLLLMLILSVWRLIDIIRGKTMPNNGLTPEEMEDVLQAEKQRKDEIAKRAVAEYVETERLKAQIAQRAVEEYLMAQMKNAMDKAEDNNDFMSTT